jgi:hypothetical protein
MALTTEDLSSISSIVSNASELSEDRLVTTIIQNFTRVDERFDQVDSGILEIKADTAQVKHNTARLGDNLQE